MRSLQSARTLEDLTTYYGAGRSGRIGILSEHVRVALELRLGTTRTLAGGAEWVVPIAGGRAFPVLCSEIVPDWTEDGPCEARCGSLARAPFGACDSHSELLAAWAAEREAEMAGV